MLSGQDSPTHSRALNRAGITWHNRAAGSTWGSPHRYSLPPPPEPKIGGQGPPLLSPQHGSTKWVTPQTVSKWTQDLLSTVRTLLILGGYPGTCGRASQVSLVVKNLPVNAGDLRGSGRSLDRGHSHTPQYPCLENPVDRGAWQTVSPQCPKELDTTEYT